MMRRFLGTCFVLCAVAVVVPWLIEEWDMWGSDPLLIEGGGYGPNE
jgi:hypothetical protein